MHKPHRLRMLQTVFMAAVMAFPFVLQQQGGARLTGAVAGTDIRQKALEYLSTVHEEQRIYTEFTRVCGEREIREPGTVCPDYRDKEAVRAFVEGTDAASAESAHPAAPAETKLQLSDLTDLDQQLMRWYQDAHACPKTLQSYLPGFYDLCLSLIRTTPSRQERNGIGQRVEDRRKGMKHSAAQRKQERMQQRAQ